MVTVATSTQQVTWEKLPEDYILPDDPVDNINQPLLAVALTESLRQAGKLNKQTLTSSNYGICATLDGRITLKAPDWVFVPRITVPQDEVIRSYTPQLQGETPLIVLEFLSDRHGEEFSSRATYPPGKWFFYEQIVQVPYYGLFEPETGNFELYQLSQTTKRYELQKPDVNQRYLIAGLELMIGTWQGEWSNRQGYWLRWWDQDNQLLLWGSEAAKLANDKAERLAAQLRAAGIEPEI